MSRLHMGIDVGSTTVKVVVLDENNNTLFAEYRRHFSDIKSTVKGLFAEVKEVVKTMEKTHVSGVAKDKNVARIALVGLADRPGIAFKIFSRVAKAHINVDIILQSVGRDKTKDIAFTVPADKGEEAVAALREYCDQVGAKSLTYETGVAKISVVGAGMETHEGVAALMFEALADAGVNIQMISTSEIKVSVLIDAEDADRAVSAVHKAFFS